MNWLTFQVQFVLLSLNFNILQQPNTGFLLHCSREKDDYNNWRGPLECLTSGAPHSELFIKPKCDFRSYQRQGQTPRALSFRFCPNLTHMVYWCDDTLAMVNLLDVNQIQITDVSASRVVGLDRQDISTEKFSFLCPVHTVISYLNLIDV